MLRAAGACCLVCAVQPGYAGLRCLKSAYTCRHSLAAVDGCGWRLGRHGCGTLADGRRTARLPPQLRGGYVHVCSGGESWSAGIRMRELRPAICTAVQHGPCCQVEAGFVWWVSVVLMDRVQAGVVGDHDMVPGGLSGSHVIALGVFSSTCIYHLTSFAATVLM